jgi:hypothetical protein
LTPGPTRPSPPAFGAAGIARTEEAQPPLPIARTTEALEVRQGVGTPFPSRDYVVGDDGRDELASKLVVAAVREEAELASP